MSLYPKIDDETILLHNDCKRLLRRTSKKMIIDEVLEKLDLNKKKDDEKKDDEKKDNEKIDINRFNFYGFILNILGCNNINN